MGPNEEPSRGLSRIRPSCLEHGRCKVGPSGGGLMSRKKLTPSAAGDTHTAKKSAVMQLTFNQLYNQAVQPPTQLLVTCDVPDVHGLRVGAFAFA